MKSPIRNFEKLEFNTAYLWNMPHNIWFTDYSHQNYEAKNFFRFMKINIFPWIKVNAFSFSNIFLLKLFWKPIFIYNMQYNLFSEIQLYKIFNVLSSVPHIQLI